MMTKKPNKKACPKSTQKEIKHSRWLSPFTLAKNKFLSGFTLIEILVSMGIGVMIIIIVYVSFITGQRVYKKGVLNAELSQNGRIAMDRIGREIRQTGLIVTPLSPTPLDPPQNEVLFEDGHTSDIQYIRYYIYGTDLKRELRHYYLASDPNTWVYHSSTDSLGNPATYTIDSDQIIVQNISFLNFYGENPINMELTVEKEGKKIQYKTKNYARNI